MNLFLREVNFEDLMNSYYFRTAAVTAPRVIRKLQNHQLGALLAYYREKGIVCPPEIDLRVRVESLLNYYSVLEIASLANFIPPPDDSLFWRGAQMVLEHPVIRQYYTVNYPMALPQLLLLRIHGQHTAVAKDDSAWCHFVNFLKLDQKFNEDLHEKNFLRLLDGFRIDNFGFKEAMRVSREELILRMLLPPDQRDVRTEVVHEFSLFIEFCFNLRDLLQQLISEPLLQSEIWHRYGYWFGALGDRVEQDVGSALNQFQPMDHKAAAGTAAVRIGRCISEARILLRDLTSNTWSRAVEETVKQQPATV